MLTQRRTLMIETAPRPTRETTMTIPPAVLGIILDTGNAEHWDGLKAQTEAFLRLMPGADVMSVFLIATADGQAYPVGTVTDETFPRQWKELYRGKQSDITPGLAVMQSIMQEYTTKPPVPMFRALLLTTSPPTAPDAFARTLFALGRTPVGIGVLGRGEAQRQTLASYLTLCTHAPHVVTTLVNQDADPQQNAGMLFRLLY
jgi:hypothetical protein